MKVILTEDVRKLGKKGDIVSVSDGYARNMLIPKGLCTEATPRALNDLKLQRQHKSAEEKKLFDTAQKTAQELCGKSVEIRIKAGENGKVFGSVSNREIAVAVEEQLGIVIDRKKVMLGEPIKMLGTYVVPVKLHSDTDAEITIEVRAE